MELLNLICWSAVFGNALAGIGTTRVVSSLANRKHSSDTRRAKTGLGSIFIGALVVALLFGGEALVIVAGSNNLFALIRLTYFLLVITIPLCGLGLLVLERLPSKPPAKLTTAARFFAMVIFIVPAAIGTYASLVEPYWLETSRGNVPVLPADADAPIRIAVLADLQFDHVSAYEHEAVSKALAEKPDVIVVPGDVFQGTMEQFEQQLPAMRELFARLHAPGGVFVSLGNVDTRRELEQIIAGSEAILLVNEIQVREVNGCRLAIAGLEWDWPNDPKHNIAARACVQRLARYSDATRILLAHTPDAVDVIQEDEVELVIAGHTHGGQIQVPGFGPLVTACRQPRWMAAGGLFDLGRTRICVSRGVGHEQGAAPPMRFNCRPELPILTLTPAVRRESPAEAAR